MKNKMSMESVEIMNRKVLNFNLFLCSVLTYALNKDEMALNENLGLRAL